MSIRPLFKGLGILEVVAMAGVYRDWIHTKMKPIVTDDDGACWDANEKTQVILWSFASMGTMQLVMDANQ